MTKRKRSVKPATKAKPENSSNDKNRYLLWSIVVPLSVVALAALLLATTDLSYTIKSWFHRNEAVDAYTPDEHHVRNMELMEKHSDYIYGIDVSQYQGKINWIDLHTIHDKVPLDFVFIRATMGEDAKDKRFDENWRAAHSRAKLRGAYHYFRPNENSIKQANNFIKAVKLKPGDLPPVLDIEERPRKQSIDSLKVGLKRWLDAVESHYGVQPILYSGDSYYSDFLEKEFSKYVLWIANYNFWVDKPKKHWNFWQFSEKGYVNGIKGNVDVNMFKGDIEELEALALRY